MMFNPVRFIVVAALWVVSLVIFYLLFFTQNQEQYLLLHTSLDKYQKLVTTITTLFRFADNWNWLTLTFSFSVSIIIFCVNDTLFKYILEKRLNLISKEFYSGGVLWSIRMSLNFVSSILQLVITAYLLNILVSTPRIYSPEELKGSDYVVLLLGTSKYLHQSQNLNMYYTERIMTTLELYKTGKVASVVVSGDHAGEHYSEPTDMRNDLIKGGVPQDKIFLDMKGYRTFDSIKRMKVKPGQTIVIVSQYFHLERALYLSRASGVNAIGVAAEGQMTMSMLKREMFAKTKVLMDIYILNTQAYGIAAHPRRNIKPQTTDVILLCAVLVTVFLAGRLSRQLLFY